MKGKENKDNLEDFFNHSLESFNEVPSDKIWDGIADQISHVAAKSPTPLTPQTLTTPKKNINNKLLLPFFIVGLLFFIASTFILNQQLQDARLLNQKLAHVQKEAIVKGENYEALEKYFIKCANITGFTNESFYSVSPKISEL